MNVYTIEPLDDGTGRWLVKNTVKGWFFPCENKSQAEFLFDRFVEVTSAPNMEMSVQDCLNEWEKSVDELFDKEVELYKAKEDYEKASEKLLADAVKEKSETGRDVIKEKYGGNNDKTRAKYVKEMLDKDKARIKALEFRIGHLKRRVSFLKTLVKVKISITSEE